MKREESLPQYGFLSDRKMVGEKPITTSELTIREEALAPVVEFRSKIIGGETASSFSIQDICTEFI